MAIDEAIFNSCIRKNSPPTIRFYTFFPDSITLGYFQSISKDFDVEKLKSSKIPFTRRLTGGKAIYHSGSLTYSVVFSRDDVENYTKKDIFLHIGKCLVRGLHEIGIQSGMNTLKPDRKKTAAHANCFLATSEYEIVNGQNQKLIGSAQVFREDTVMQQGCIPLNNNYLLISQFTKKNKERFRLNSEDSTLSSKTFDFVLKSFLHGFAHYIPLKKQSLTQLEKKAKLDYMTKYESGDWIFCR